MMNRRRLGLLLLVSGALILIVMFLRFEFVFVSLSLFDFMRGALSGGKWTLFRLALVALFILAVVGVLVGTMLTAQRTRYARR